MESANLQHQLQDQRGSSTSSLAAAPSCYGFGNNNHFWTSSSTTTNNTTFIGNSNPNYNGRQKSDNLVSPLNSSMVQDHDLGFHWNSNNAGADQSFSSHQSAHDLQLAKIKEEQCFPKFTELLNSPSNMDDYYFLPQIIKNEHKDLNHELSEKLLLKTLSSSCQINGHQISTGDFLSNNNNNNNNGVQVGRGHFSQIYPSINISNLNQSSSSSSSTTTAMSSSSSSSSSLDMSLRALDHLASAATFSGNLNDNLGVGGANSSFGLDQMHQPHNRLSCAAHRKVISSFNNEAIEAKRPGTSMEAKGSAQAAQKKSRLESRTPCPPFKVRKEKLGDRIAALQQLVAPFGKTDTASVLMEAIGYIKFLQNQVETLSVPYMKSAARNKSYKTMQGGPKENGNGEAKRDLRSRGLCLVPLSCMSYVTGDGGGGSVWPPPNFGGET